ncbi:MAG: hypothetical protein ACW987_18380 [Candidatus Thorarchaeota archaeon]|jgi:hypothetical protein
MSKPETHEEICGRCNGSGEGRYINSVCSDCNGSGVRIFNDEGELFEPGYPAYEDWNPENDWFPGDDDFPEVE